MPGEPARRQSPAGAPMEVALCAAIEWSLLVAAIKLWYVESDKLSHFLYICIYKSDRQWNGLPEAIGFEHYSPQSCYLFIYLSISLFIYLRSPFCLHPSVQQCCAVPAHDWGLLGRVLGVGATHAQSRTPSVGGHRLVGDTSGSSLRSTRAPQISRSASQAAVTPRGLLEGTGWGSDQLTSWAEEELLSESQR